MRVERFALEAAGDEWDLLAEQSGNIFATKEWISIWWRYFGMHEPYLARVHAGDGRLVAIMPLYCWSRRPLRIVRFLGHGPGDELGPVCAPADRLQAGHALREVASTLPWRWDVLLAEYLPGTGWARSIGGRLLRRHASPVLVSHGADWDAFLAERSRNFRQQLQRKERRLLRNHDLRFRLCQDRQTLQPDLTVLFALHEARWRGESPAFAGASKEFHREFAACALERGWLRLWLLELDDRPVAAWYGFRFAGREFYYQAGRDPEFANLSIGSVLLAHTIRAALNDGVREYRLLRGDESYKYRFASMDPGVETIAYGRNARGKIAVVAGAATRGLGRFPNVLRRPLRF